MTFRPYFFLIRLTLSVALTALPLSAIAEDTVTPMVTGGQVGNNARIIFKWQESVRFTARARGELLTLEFSRPIAADFSPLLARIGDFVTRAEVSDDAKTVTFTLTYPYRIKSFMSKHLSGVDLIDNRVPTTPQVATDTPEKPDSILPPMPGEILPPPLLAKGHDKEDRVTETAAPEDAVADAEHSQPDMLSVFMAPQDGVGRITFDWQVPVRYRVITDKTHVTVEFDREATAPLPVLSDAMKPYLDSIGSKREDHHLIYMLDLPEGATVKYFNEKHKVVVDIHVPRDVLSAREKTLTPPENKMPAPQSTATKPAPSVKPQKVTAAKKADAAPKTKASTTPVASAPVASVAVTDYPYEVTFPWNEPVAAAVFSRGSYSWIIFDKPANADLAPLAQQAFVSDAELLPSDTATIIRFRNPQGLHAQASKNGENWVFAFSPELAPTFVSIPVEIAREAGGAPRLFLPVLGSGAPVTVTDPEAGDTLTIIPVSKPGAGLRLPRRYVEMELLASDQGLVTRAITDHAAAIQFRNGIQLGHSGSTVSDNGFILSANLPAMKDEEFLGRQNSTTLFPYYQWKRPDEIPFRDREQQLRSKIVDGLPDNANGARLRLAEFYLSEAMYPEATVLLDLIAESNPEFALSKHVPALRGLADFMRDDMDAAVVDFDNPSLDGIDEAVFWRNIIPAARDTLATPLTYDFFAQRYAAQYAPDVQRKLAFTAAEYFIAHQRYPEAQSALSTIPDSDSTPAGARKYKSYLLGQIAAANNQITTALQNWKPLSEDIEDRFIRAKAGLALTKLLIEKGRVNTQEAITQLDPLALVWRGDQTEADVLKLLGQLRIDNQEYAEGLYAWRDLVTSFPNDPENQAYAQKMAEVFLQLFNRGGADSMAPLDALTLYYDFRELTPAGEEGDAMIRNLSDRLASVDLLDRAAALLTHQIRFRLAGEEKARVGARLALIHLLNKKPDLAKEVLEASGFDKLNDTLKTTRNHLMIKALAESGDYKKAMELLKDDTSATAQMLRTDVLWEMKDWPTTIGYLEKLLYERELNPAPLDKLESENILRLGLAYIFGGKFKELNTLHDRFAALMAENPYNETFAFITEKHEFIDHTNFDKINDEIGSFETFIGDYKKSIENKSLSETIQ